MSYARSIDLDARILRAIHEEELSPALVQEIFSHQYDGIPAYRAFCDAHNISPNNIQRWSDIPSFPTTAFRLARMASFPNAATKATFLTTGTTDESRRGRHEMDTLALYEASALTSFRSLVPVPKDPPHFLSLIPNRFDAPHSSLSYMVDAMARELHSPIVAATLEALRAASRDSRPVFITATTVALSDLLSDLEAKSLRYSLPAGSFLFETGGRKGRRNIPTSAVLAEQAQRLLDIPIDRFFGEYGMTELSTPAWGHLIEDKMIYQFPTWCPWEIEGGKSEGLLRLFDPANRGSVSALCVGDWVRRVGNGFEVLGRAVDSEIRGCSLAVAPPPAKGRSPSNDLEPILPKALPRVSMTQVIEALSILTDQFLKTTKDPGLQATFGALQKPNLKTVAQEAFPKGWDLPSPLPAVFVPAGNLPVTGVFDFYASLLAGVPSIHRMSKRGGLILKELHQSLADINADVANLMTVLTTDSSDDEATRTLFEGARTIVAQGDDETLDHLLTLAPASASFLPYPSAISMAVIPHNTALTDEDLQGLARDIYIWEQQGCLSPQILWIENPSEAESILIRLFEASEEVATKLGRTPTPRAVGALSWIRSIDLVERCAIWMTSPHLTVARVEKPRIDWFSTPGFIQVVVGEAPSNMERLTAIALPASAKDDLADPWVKKDPSIRVAQMGELQRPPLAWRQHGIDRLLSLRPRGSA